MRRSLVRFAVAVAVLVTMLQWSRPAYADYVVTGTVSEIKLVYKNSAGAEVDGIFFRFTDPNQTATCNQNTAPKYAAIDTTNLFYREIYAMLLVSKKGAPITCSLSNNTTCTVWACTLN